ncbi:MAG TPA: tetratricopeptide repeat protein, partial [Polyangiaceae bacterium]|nr:tetratricopeptide repeat protein [Polyangiaceae bacterium]
GLSASPTDRFPSMDALLAELERARGPLRPWLGASALIAALAIVGGALWARQGGGRQVPCEDASRHVERAWSAARGEAVASALRRTGAPYAEAAAREATRALDAYAARWAKQRVEVCKAARGEPTDEAARGGGPTNEAARGGRPTDEATALRTACLDERLHEFRALGDRLLEADRGVAEHAAQATHRLSDVEACAPPRSLAGPTPPPDSATRAEVEALRARLGEARVLGHTGRQQQGLEAARPLAERAQQLGYRPLEAEALLLVGQLAAQSGDDAAAERALERAAWAAEAGRHEGAAAQALLELLRLRGGYQAYYEQVEPLARRVEALLERLGGDHELEAQLRQTLGHSDVARGRYQAAERELERALGLLERKHGADDPRVLPALSELGKLATLRGRFPDATAYFERALSIARRSFGDGHPVAARALCDAASAPYVREGRRGPAAAAYEQALTALELALGPEHLALADQLDHLALALLERGHAAEALAPSRRAASIAEKALGAAPPMLPLYLTRLAAALVGDGRPAEALPLVERALRLARERFGEEHARVAEALRVLGDVQKKLGRLPEARESLHRGHAMSVRTIGPDYAAGDALRSLGELSLRAKQPAQALEPLEGALRAYQQRDAVGPLAQTNALLARALWESDRDRARAGALAADALERLKADARSSAEGAELERWMRQHRVPLRRPEVPISDHRLASPNESRLRPSVTVAERRPPQTIGYHRRTKATSDHRLPSPNESRLRPSVVSGERGPSQTIGYYRRTRAID